MIISALAQSLHTSSVAKKRTECILHYQSIFNSVTESVNLGENIKIVSTLWLVPQCLDTLSNVFKNDSTDISMIVRPLGVFCIDPTGG